MTFFSSSRAAIVACFALCLAYPILGIPAVGLDRRAPQASGSTPPWGTGTPPWGTGPPPWVTGRPSGSGSASASQTSSEQVVTTTIVSSAAGARPAETESPSSSASEASSNNIVRVAVPAAVVPTVVVLAIVAGVLLCIRRHRRKQNQEPAVDAFPRGHTPSASSSDPMMAGVGAAPLTRGDRKTANPLGGYTSPSFPSASQQTSQLPSSGDHNAEAPPAYDSLSSSGASSSVPLVRQPDHDHEPEGSAGFTVVEGKGR